MGRNITPMVPRPYPRYWPNPQTTLPKAAPNQPTAYKNPPPSKPGIGGGGNP